MSKSLWLAFAGVLALGAGAAAAIYVATRPAGTGFAAGQRPALQSDALLAEPPAPTAAPIATPSGSQNAGAPAPDGAVPPAAAQRAPVVRAPAEVPVAPRRERFGSMKEWLNRRSSRQGGNASAPATDGEEREAQPPRQGPRVSRRTGLGAPPVVEDEPERPSSPPGK